MDTIENDPKKSVEDINVLCEKQVMEILGVAQDVYATSEKKVRKLNLRKNSFKVYISRKTEWIKNIWALIGQIALRTLIFKL